MAPEGRVERGCSVPERSYRKLQTERTEGVELAWQREGTALNYLCSLAFTLSTTSTVKWVYLQGDVPSTTCSSCASCCLLGLHIRLLRLPRTEPSSGHTEESVVASAPPISPLPWAARGGPAAPTKGQTTCSRCSSSISSSWDSAESSRSTKAGTNPGRCQGKGGPVQGWV